MISKCVKFSLGDQSEQVFIVKSGFKDLYLIFYESAYETTEYEYRNLAWLLHTYPNHKEEFSQL